jgi:cytoskeletal protein RodZ
MRRPQSIILSLLLLLVLVGFPACASRQTAQPTQPPKATPSPTPIARTESSEDDSSSSEEDTQAEDQSSDDDSDAEAKDFHGYRCKADCSGHEAGYRWAEEHDIDDPDKCGGKSQSFIEGCRAWAEENP